MSEQADGAQSLSTVIAAGDNVAIAGVLAICARLALKGVFDRSDVEKVLKLMTDEATDRPDVLGHIEQRRGQLIELTERGLTGSPPLQE